MPTGAWRAQTRINGPGMLNTRAWDRDDHTAKDSNPGARHNSWDPAQGMSATPTGITTVQDSWSVDESRAVQIDQTPQDHADGLGIGGGLSTEQSMAANAAAHKVDRGATAARRFLAPEAEDGTYRADLEAQPEFQAGQPADLRFKMQSDPEISPNARMGNRVVRVLNRVYKTMRWESDHRPLYVTNAYSGGDQAPVAGGANAVSPYSSLARLVRNTPADPQLRRTPPSWDDSQMVAPVDAAPDYGFASWSL